MRPLRPCLPALLLVIGLSATGAAEEPKSASTDKEKQEAPKSEKPKRIEFGVELRWREEFRDNADLQPANDFDGYLGQRIRAHLRIRVHPHLTAYVQGQDVWLYGAE